MKNILLLAFLFPITLLGQQLPERMAFAENSYVWNPAMTGLWNYWELSTTYRRQWTGFNDAPRTTMINVQYPFQKQNSSIGGYFMHDVVKPMKFTSFAFNYAYKFKLGFFKEDRLSLGFNAVLSQFFVDGLEIEVNDPDDEVLPAGENTKFAMNGGFGFFYTTYGKGDLDKDFFFIGVAVNQLFPSDLIFDEFGGISNFKRRIHGNAVLGGRFVDDDLFFEQTVWINYAAPNIIDANLNIKVEKIDSFWASMAYATSQLLTIQVGYIIAGGVAKDGTLRIGTQGGFNMGTVGTSRGASYDFFLAYRYRL